MEPKTPSKKPQPRKALKPTKLVAEEIAVRIIGIADMYYKAALEQKSRMGKGITYEECLGMAHTAINIERDKA